MDAANESLDGVSPAGEQSRWQWLIAFVVTFILGVVGAFVTTDTWNEDLSVPFEYAGDALMAVLPIKTMLDTGWWYETDRLGAPLGMSWYDFPANANTHFAVLKVMSLFEQDPFRLLNYYVILGFPLVAVCSLAAFRAFGLPIVPSIFGSLIFAFAPYHFWRGFAHPWLSSYFTIPLGMIAVAWVLRDRSGLFFDAGEDGRWKFRWRSWRTVVAVLCCVALGFDFPYYPVFMCFLFLVVGPYVALQLRSWRPLARSAMLIAVTGACFSLSLVPNLLYWAQNGTNDAESIDTHRHWLASEFWGLKIAALLMPAREHRIPALEAIQTEYHTRSVVQSSCDSMALGTLAAGGFLALIAWTLLRLHRGRGPGAELMDWMSVLNLACVLLATVGGFSVLVNFFAVSLLRCYDRISIVIMFFSTVPLCVLLAAIERRIGGRFLARTGYLCVVAGLAVAGLWDQSGFFRLHTGGGEVAFASDRKFVGRIEKVVGTDGAVFQYPVQHFLSTAGRSEGRHSHLRCFLHSSDVAWSGEAVAGRRAAEIQSLIDNQPTDEAVESIAILGFDGICVDRSMYPQAPKVFEAELFRITGAMPLVSDDEKLLFFPLSNYVKRLEARYTPQQIALNRKRLMWPVGLSWIGFDRLEVVPTARYRWCQSNEAQLQIENYGDETCVVDVNFLASGAVAEPGELTIEGLSIRHSCEIGFGSRTPVSFKVTIPKGRHEIRFIADTEPLKTPSRDVMFRIDEFEMHMTEIGGKPLPERDPSKTAGRQSTGSTL